MSATVSDFFQKVPALARNWWPTWFGINGRLALDYAKMQYFFFHLLLIDTGMVEKYHPNGFYKYISVQP